MFRLLVMVDGLGKPPPVAWNDLANQLSDLMGATTLYFNYSDFIGGVKSVNFSNTRVVAVGHSLGALEVLQATGQLAMSAAIGIDPVYRNWSSDPIRIGRMTPNIRCYRRSRTLSIPPSVGVWSKSGVENVEVNAGWFGHNKIIEKATPQIVEFVKAVVL